MEEKFLMQLYGQNVLFILLFIFFKWYFFHQVVKCTWWKILWEWMRVKTQHSCLLLHKNIFINSLFLVLLPFKVISFVCFFLSSHTIPLCGILSLIIHTFSSSRLSLQFQFAFKLSHNEQNISGKKKCIPFPGLWWRCVENYEGGEKTPVNAGQLVALRSCLPTMP